MVKVIFSMWPEYLKKPEFRAIDQLKNHPGVQFHEIHTSGHARVQDLQKLVGSIKPKKLCPMHTDKPELFGETFKGTEMILLKDGEVFEL